MPSVWAYCADLYRSNPGGTVKLTSLAVTGPPVRGSDGERSAINEQAELVGECPVVVSRLGGKDQSCLLDTGSQVSTISEACFLEHYAHLKSEVSESFITLTAANNLPIPVVGVVWMEMVVCGRELGRKGLLVVSSPGLSHGPVILGMNVLRHLDQLLFQENGPQYWRNLGVQRPVQQALQQVGRRGTRALGTIEEHLGLLKVGHHQRLELPPRQEVLIPLEVRTHQRLNGMEVMVEPTDVLRVGSGVMVARTVSVVTGGKVSVRFCNLTDQLCRVPAGTVIAQVVAIHENSVQGMRKLSLRPEASEAWALSVQVEEQEGPCPEWNGTMIRTQMDVSLEECAAGDVAKLDQMLWNRQKVFSRHEEDFGYTEDLQHEIRTGDAPPVRERYRPIPPRLYQEVKSMLRQMLDNHVIQESKSPWAAPIVLVRKKDGTIRFCVDYRKLNSCTVRDAYPLPRIEESLAALGNAKFFSTLDLASGYWQVPVAPQDREKTAFVTPMGLFEFCRMPGLWLRQWSVDAESRKSVEGLPYTCQALFREALDAWIATATAGEIFLDWLDRMGLCKALVSNMAAPVQQTHFSVLHQNSPWPLRKLLPSGSKPAAAASGYYEQTRHSNPLPRHTDPSQQPSTAAARQTPER
ncbi:uncharacterized protein LOC134949857 [Pseudophryne corroboree]|uniref:uncharacterized protein LOC134949857 n=1 Tax=Pseudophryne corroboree TaxID=495146 RepID=UPI0030820039